VALNAIVFTVTALLVLHTITYSSHNSCSDYSVSACDGPRTGPHCSQKQLLCCKFSESLQQNPLRRLLWKKHALV